MLCGSLMMGLGACNSSDDSNESNAPSVQQPSTKQEISGTAAAGAPIVGKVTVKDAKGVQKTVDIAADGKYSVDVSGMTAPFVFHAYGKVGGRDVSLVSAATSEDINKTINITPANIGAAASSHTHNNYATNSVVFTIQNNVEALQTDVSTLKTQMGDVENILKEINGE